MLTLQLILFLLASGPILYISRRALRQPRSHGFYRFFAWEIILILFLRNMPVWFSGPLAWNQLISWFLLIICCVPVILGTRMLKQARQEGSNASAQSRQDEPLFEFEKTTALVTSGIYRYIRHPLYSSLLLLDWGIFFKRPDLVGLLLALAASLFLGVTASMEEIENLRFFGAAYQDYKRHTRRFIPYLF
jgi:protein-S-isoprenylcysteine O-methyltransferase Ste14